MSEVQNYIVLPLRNLERRKHTFAFNVESDFFSAFQNPEIAEGLAEISLEVEMHSHFMDVILTFCGTLAVSCDRCLDNFDIPVKGENLLSVRFDKAPEDMEEENTEKDIMYINPEEEEIDLTVYVYESICLALPIRRIHGNGANGKSLCNPNMLKYISNLQTMEKESPFNILKSK